jgi:hypothetical protein
VILQNLFEEESSKTMLVLRNIQKNDNIFRGLFFKQSLYIMI